MNVLGIWDGHDAGAALLQHGRLRFAVNEERLTRRKLEVRFPTRSIEACLASADLRAEDVDVVAASTTDPAKTLPLVFETLVTVAPRGGLRPLLATSWSTDPQGTRWRVRLRPVLFVLLM